MHVVLKTEHKNIKKILKIALISLLSITLLLVIAVFSLRYPAVQTFVTQKIASYLSQQLHSNITVGNVYFKPFSSIELKEINIDDRKGQQLFRAKNLKATLSFARLFENELQIRKLIVEDAFANYEIYKDSTNISFLIDYFTSDKKDKKDKSASLNLKVQEIILKNNQFKLTNHCYKTKGNGIDFNDLDIKAISGEIANIEFSKTEVKANLHQLTFREKSGFYLYDFSAKSSVSGKKMEFENLLLRSNRSKIADYLLFEYQSFADFEDFINKVRIKGNLKDAFIDSRDIDFFAPQMADIRFLASIANGKVAGSVAHLQAKDAAIKTGTTSLHGDFRIDELPHIEKTKFDFDLTLLRTSATDVEKLISELTPQRNFKLPTQLHQLGTVSYSGKLSGYYHDFAIDGFAKTTLGSLKMNSKISLLPSLQYEGTVSSPSFQVGELLKSQNIGVSAFDMKFHGKGSDKESLHLYTEGNINNFSFKEYTYKNLQLNGEIIDRVFFASGMLLDPYATLAFNGEVDWTTDTPAFELSAEVDLLNLKKLNLFTKDSIVIHNSNMTAEIQGNSLNSLNGHVASDHIQFQSTRGDFIMNYLDFESRGNEQSKLLTIKSDVVDGEISGQIDLNTIIPYFRSLAMRYAPAINIDAAGYNPQNFDLKLNIKSFNPISALFDPNLRLDDGATLAATFSSDDYTAIFDAYSPSVSYKGMKLTNLTLTEKADDRAFSLSAEADRFSFSDSTYVDSIRIHNVLANDSLNFQLSLSEKSRANYLNLNGNIHFAHNKPAYIRFEQSTIVLNREQWTINEDADLRVSKGKFYLKNLSLRRDKQEVNLNGILSNENDNLDIGFKDFSLSALSGVTKPSGIQLQGNLSGDMRIHSVFNKPNFSAHITTTPIIFNSLPIGSLRINADFDPQNGLVQLKSNLLDVDGNGLDLAGTYAVGKTDALRLQGKVNNIDLGIAQPFLRSLIRDLYGKMSGDVHITGSLSRPVISGSANIREASFLVNYLNTKYTIANQSSLIQDNRILFNNLNILDAKNSTAVAQGTIDLSKLTDPVLDIEARAENFQLLNTNRKDNEMFFGTAYGSGTFRFKGPTTGINIDINAQSNPNTVITIPFNSSLKVSDNDFFYFIHPDSVSDDRPIAKRLFKGLTMNMDLQLTRDAEINLENNVGSLKGVGTGNVSLRISNLGDFEMFGDYFVLAGKFHFTAQDFFNKFFDLKEGGTIRWAGNPAEATVNLSASYQQRTSIAPLYNAAGRTENNDRILAQADMILKGTLSQPEISFDLNFPQDPYVKDELQGYLSDVNNVNQQAISLIVRRSFTPASTQEFGREVNNTLLSAGTEIAFNQLNSIISQSLNMNFLDLNIRSFNDASASLRFFDDRLIFTGGVSDRSQSQLTDLTVFSDQIATDAEVTFRLRQDGNLVLRAYNRLNSRNFLFTPYSDYISAVGLVYRQEFNSLSEFWRKLWLWNDRKQQTTTLTAPNTSDKD